MKETFEKRVIENYFPFSQVNEIAFKESNAKRFYRPVLTLGKWFARRLGSVFRSILIYAAMTSAENEITDNTNLTKQFWDLYLQEHDFKNLKILDPFCGGGTTVVEASRLGFGGIIAGDLNPVAWFIVKKEMEGINLDGLDEEFDRISSKLKNDLLKYYKTHCIHCSHQADVMYFFWVKEINCDHCDNILPLFRSYLFAYYQKKTSPSYLICPKCENIFLADSHSSVHCPTCEYSFDPMSYIVRRGKYHCLHCGHSGKIVETNAKRGRPLERMYALEYYCKVCNHRSYKRADNEDFELFQQAESEFQRIREELPLPHQDVPVGAKTQELLNHKIHSFVQMFNSRQLLSLGKLLQMILQIKNQNQQEFFLITFSAALEYNNLLCEYHRKNHYIYNLFRKHAFPATLNPVENNVWGTKFGTGTFKNFFAKTIKIKKFCQHPYEYYITKNGKTKRKPMIRPINGNIVSSYSELLKNPTNNIFLYCNSSNQIKIPDHSIDLVITDPPYYDNVQYAELSDFYYVWLRLGLKNYYPWFKSQLTPKKPEIVKNPKTGKSTETYQQGLQEVFKEIFRVLKDQGLLIFTFHHKKLKAWASVIQSLLDSRFYIEAVYPIRAEMMTSTQIRGKSSIEHDIIFVCRKQWKNPTPMEWETILPLIKQNVTRKLHSLTRNGQLLSKEDKLVIQLGEGLKHLSQHFPQISFESKPFSLMAALENLAIINEND
ncbi:MAG: DUF1156 domain-containing protein [Candidatus Hodarchaeales archaeon]